MNIKQKKFLAFGILALIFLANFLIVSSALATQPLGNTAINGFRNAADSAYGDSKGKNVDQLTFLSGLIFIINRLLEFTGLVFLLIVLYAGFRWFSSKGNEEEIKKAKNMLVEAIIGLIIIFSARIITEFILTQFGTVSAT